MLRGLPERNGGTAAAGKSEAGPVTAGGRHGFLLTLGGRFRNQGASREVVLSALRAANKESCQPPKPDFEIIGIADWLMTKEPGYRLTRKDFEATEPGYVPPAEKSLDDRVKAVIEAKDVSLAYTAEFIGACVEAGDAAAFTARQALKKEFGKEFVLKGVEGAWDVRYKRAADRARHAAAKDEPLTWRDSLLLSEKGAVLACYENAALFAENSVEWHGVLGYNEFTGGHVVLEKAPHPVTAKPGAEIEDHFDTEVTRWFERAGCMVKPEVARRTVDRMARLNAFHPVRDYLNGLPPWDGEKRIDCWLFDYCKVSRRRVNERDEEIFNTFASEAGAKFLISAVARVFEPGCKADHVLMLEGKTGIGKSTAAKALAGEEFFTDQLSDLGSKDASMQVRGIWIAEMADIHALARSDREKAKAFITQTFERFRLPYGARLTKFQRQCVFIGTTESSEWNNDERGARRFWPVLCEGKIDTEGLLRDRDQMWAEALARYRDGDRWYLHLENTVKEAEEEQSDRYAVDPWQEKVMAYACRSKTGVGLQEVLSHGLGMDIDRQGRAESNRVAACLRFARWERRQVREGRNRYWRYFPPEGAQMPLTESS
jgi:predicted P-loop ATPase